MLPKVNITDLNVFRIHVVTVRSIVKCHFVVNDASHEENSGTVVLAFLVPCYNTVACSNRK